MVWKIDRNDPSSFQFVWNIHPEDQLSSIHFYLIRDRGYHITEGIEITIQEYKWIRRSHSKKKLMELIRLPR